MLSVDVYIMLCLVGDAVGRVGNAGKALPAPLEFECKGPLYCFGSRRVPRRRWSGSVGARRHLRQSRQGVGTKMYGFGEVAIVPVQWSFKSKTQPF
jgi:hypothetical protein